MIRILERSATPPAMRRNRLGRLSEPQELFVETLAAAGAVRVLEFDGVEGGYAITDGGDLLVEIHLEDRVLGKTEPALDALVETAGVRRLLAQTFDPLAILLGLARGSPPKITAMLYRVIVDRGFQPRADLVARPGAPGDVAELAALSDDFFEGAPEIEAYLAAGGLMVYRRPEGELVGAGVMKRVIPGVDGVDIGMVVAPAHRRRGYGVHIVSHLKAHCLASGWRPICGCAIDNHASQRTLERAGFASLHSSVEFALEESG